MDNIGLREAGEEKVGLDDELDELQCALRVTCTPPVLVGEACCESVPPTAPPTCGIVLRRIGRSTDLFDRRQCSLVWPAGYTLRASLR